MSAAPFHNLSHDVPFDTDPVDLDALRDRSQPFLGQWNQLISQTNWTKGGIIAEWRRNLQEQSQPASAWSDESWSRLVGGVSPQHVGRLRRTSERFGEQWSSFAGLYWSHFYAALDWDDAEMWLEGAVQNGWSVSRMRLQRWEVSGGGAEDHPERPGNEIVVSEIDEENSSLTAELPTERERGNFSSGPLDEGPDFGGDLPSNGGDRGEIVELADIPRLSTQALFERFQNLPEDVADAVEAFKLAIIRHRAAGWTEISQSQMTELLGALRTLASSTADAHGNG